MKRASCLSWLILTLTFCIPSRGEGPAIPIPETIRAVGVPPIPVTVRQALNRYQNIRSASFQDWASDGSGMYIITRFAEVPQVHVVSQAAGSRFQLTFLPERVLSVAARPKHEQFLYMIDEGGGENYQLFLQNRYVGEARRVTDGKSRNLAPKWSPSGELLAWSSNARNGRDMDLYVASPLDPHFLRRFKEVTGQWTVSDWSPDETKVLAVEEISIHEAYIHVIDVATGKTETITPRPIDPEAERVFAGAAKWSKDGKAIYYLTDKGNEFRRLVRYELASGQVRSVTGEIPGDIEEFDLSADGRFIALVANENGTGQIRMLDANSGTNALAASPSRLPAGQVANLKFRPVGFQFAFTFSSATAPSDAYAFTSFDGPTERWTWSETGGLDSQSFAEPRRVTYPSFDGRQIPAFVYHPPARKFPGPRPVLIDIHGGPEGQFRPGFLGRLNYLIDELGLAVIFPNVRGSSGYGKTYLKLDNGMHRADAVQDIGALLDWIAKQPELDKGRVGVIGGSYGGFMSLAVQTKYNDRIKAGIDIVGISNFVTFLKNTQGYRRDLRRAEYGDERDPSMRAYLEQVSPLAGAEKIRTPILVVQGQNDPRVPISEAEQMVAALKKNGIPVWYVVGTNEGHGFAKKANQDYLQAVEVEFLRRYLLGEGAEQQAKGVAERYRVSGTVTYKGEPIAEGTIVLHPVDPGGHRASGAIRDGRYTLTTVNADDGALPGTYTVTIEVVGGGGAGKLPARYSNPGTSGMTCQIRAGSNFLDFDLKD
jgi:dipeptidyl aminopeptidase/acylaminoacyl peptidase